MSESVFNFIEPEMVVIPAGEFLMGSETGAPNERPVHAVWVDAFALAIAPVTNEEYALFVQAVGYKSPPFWHQSKFQRSNQPVIGPSWHDGMAYCEWLCRLTRKSFRLPTEAEREKASRGGMEGREYPWGDELPGDCLGGRTSVLPPVGTEGPNGYGLFNTSEGVHEWCADSYDRSYYQNSPRYNPTGPTHCERRVARGGSWRHRIRFARCAARSSLAPDKHFSDFGFRCAMTLL